MTMLRTRNQIFGDISDILHLIIQQFCSHLKSVQFLVYSVFQNCRFLISNKLFRFIVFLFPRETLTLSALRNLFV